ncbi:MAG: hypothetical protein E6Q97_12340 [Desulfurellales bacterium]|nr:MAG: hypothetical protein E6Q97_12340 [Desulfurellales bacterium]
MSEQRRAAPTFAAHAVARKLGKLTMVPRSAAQGTPKRGWRVRQLTDYSVEIYWEPGRNATHPYGADDLMAWRDVQRAVGVMHAEAEALARTGKGRKIYVSSRRDEASEWRIGMHAAQWYPTVRERQEMDDVA